MYVREKKKEPTECEVKFERTFAANERNVIYKVNSCMVDNNGV